MTIALPTFFVKEAKFYFDLTDPLFIKVRHELFIGRHELESTDLLVLEGNGLVPHCQSVLLNGHPIAWKDRLTNFTTSVSLDASEAIESETIDKHLSDKALETLDAVGEQSLNPVSLENSSIPLPMDSDLQKIPPEPLGSRVLLSVEDVPDEAFLAFEIWHPVSSLDSSLIHYSDSAGLFMMTSASNFSSLMWKITDPQHQSMYDNLKSPSMRYEIEASLDQYPTLISNGSMIDWQKNRKTHTVCFWETSTLPLFQLRLAAMALQEKRYDIIYSNGAESMLSLWGAESLTPEQELFFTTALTELLKWEESQPQFSPAVQYQIVLTQNRSDDALSQDAFSLFNIPLIESLWNEHLLQDGNDSLGERINPLAAYYFKDRDPSALKIFTVWHRMLRQASKT